MTADRKQIALETWKRLRGALHLLVKSKQGPKAMMFCVMLVVMMFGINGLNVLNSYVGRDFMSAIEHKSFPAFQRQAILYALVFMLSTVVAVFYRFTEERLGILWREQLTWRLTEAYLRDRTYYMLDSTSGIENADQRITDDVKAFTTTTLTFTLLILNGTLTAIFFSGVLWSISKLLFSVSVIYAVCGSVITVLIGKRMIRLNYNQLDMEANFRSALIHVRENAESIALAHREGRFKLRLKSRLNDLTSNFRRIIRVNRNLGFFTTGYTYFIQIIPALIIAPLFMRGDVEFGVITQSTMAFGTLLGAFSLIVTQFQSISAFAAVIARLHLLSEAIHKAHQITPCTLQIEPCPDSIRYQNVTLHTADKSQILVDGLNLEIGGGSRCWITATDDARLVAMFRATAGVWECGGGKITRPGLEGILFLPERPYLPPGTLRDVLLRSGMESVTTDAEITLLLRKLGLDEIVAHAGGLDANKNWDDVFSIGEQHLLSIARIFLAQPSFAVFHRPDSSLTQAQISFVLAELAAQGIGVVILSKNEGPGLRGGGVHLEIMADGTWAVHQEDASEAPVLS